MQKSSVLAVIAAMMTISALVGNHAVARLKIEKPKKLQIDLFPRQIGKWKAGEDIPIDPRIQDFLPSAKIVERPYVDNAGNTIICTLITASDMLDIHNPNICLPGHGWELSNKSSLRIGKQFINKMVATRDGAQYNMWYWWVGDTVGTVPGSITLAKVFAIRKAITKENVATLSVRLFNPHNAGGDKLVEEFATAIQPHLKEIAAK